MRLCHTLTHVEIIVVAIPVHTAVVVVVVVVCGVSCPSFLQRLWFPLLYAYAASCCCCSFPYTAFILNCSFTSRLRGCPTHSCRFRLTRPPPPPPLPLPPHPQPGHSLTEAISTSIRRNRACKQSSHYSHIKIMHRDSENSENLRQPVCFLLYMVRVMIVGLLLLHLLMIIPIQH